MLACTDIDIIKDYKIFRSAYSVARKYSINVQTVYRKLKKNNVEIDGISHYINNAIGCSKESEEEIVELYNSGKSYNEINRLTGFTVSIIRSSLKRNKIKPRRAGNTYKIITDELKEVVISLYKDGMSQQKIADQFHLGQVQISRVLKRGGIIPEGRNKRHPFYKGGRLITDQGYTLIKIYSDNPYFEMSNRMGYVPEHRYVMAKSLGRLLTKSETVHHINGVRTDNRIENLQLRQGRHGNGVVFKCADCGSYHVIESKIIED